MTQQAPQRTSQQQPAPRTTQQSSTDDQGDVQGLVSRFGPIEVDWPRTLGYYGGIALAVTFEIIEPPVGIFIACIPLIKMLSSPKIAQPIRAASQVLQGAAPPLNGDAEATIRVQQGQQASQGRQAQQGK